MTIEMKKKKRNEPKMNKRDVEGGEKREVDHDRHVLVERGCG